MSRSLYILLGLIAVLLIIAILAPIIAPHPPDQSNLQNALQGSSKEYPLGTDHLGRCILSRLLYGAMTSIFSSLAIIAVIFCVGTLLGVVSGYFGGILDAVISRMITTVQAFPMLILAIAIAGILGIGIVNTIIALCLIGWTEYARIARSMVVSMKERTYIKAAKICGESDMTIIIKHVVPNIFPLLIVSASLDIAGMIMTIAALSYLGLGVEPPMAEWGAMMYMGQAYMQTNMRLIILPGLAILITAMVFNLFGDKLRDTLEVRKY